MTRPFKKGKTSLKVKVVCLHFLAFIHNNKTLLFTPECNGAVQPRPEEPGQPRKEL